MDRYTELARAHRYVLKMDVRRFFPSVDHEILLDLLTRPLPEEPLRNLIDRILDGGHAAAERFDPYLRSRKNRSGDSLRAEGISNGADFRERGEVVQPFAAACAEIHLHVAYDQGPAAGPRAHVAQRRPYRSSPARGAEHGSVTGHHAALLFDETRM